jgi:alpha-L-rhamnosidase
MHITNLRCCLLTNPSGLDRPDPELSWELAGPEPGSTRQTAYRLAVATSPDLLETPDLWDSGRVTSDRSAFVIYEGRPLPARTECHWRVTIWDESEQCIVSEVARWSMGLLSETDWSALWIGCDEPPEHPAAWYGSAQWIWAQDTRPAAWTFSRRFHLDPAELGSLSEGLLEVLADDEAEVLLNDTPICRAPRARANLNLYPGAIPFWISPDRFLPGTNLLSITARKRPGPDTIAKIDAAGIIARLSLVFGPDRAERSVQTDGDWTCHGADGSEEPVVELGAYGQAPWHLVTPEEYPNLPARYLRREVDLPTTPTRAVLYFSGLGLSEAFINGRKVGDEVLSPNPTDYDRRVFFRTHEVTHLLRGGRNALGALLGNGRYFAPRIRVPMPMQQYGCPKMLWQLEMTFPDGSTQTVTSSPDWKLSTAGPIGWNNEFDGEQFDARRSFDGWTQPGFDDAAWKPASSVAPPGGVIQAQLAEPLRVIRQIRAAKSWRTKYGTTIHDFGENIAGWCHVRVQGPAGARIRLLHAEALDGNDALFSDNLRSAHCGDTLVLDGRPLEYEPRFTIHGFRYVEVREEIAPTTALEIVACVVHDDVKSAGRFECSDPVINGIFAAARRGILGNYRGMPTDCPQRDERMGWLGDRAVGAAGEMFAFDVAAFYRKWLDDIREAQTPSGCVPDVAPPYWRIYTDNVTWPACMTFIPHWLHRHYGDTPAATRNFPAARRWIDHLLAMRHEGLIERDVYADWCVPPESPNLIHSAAPERQTPGPLVASCYMVRILEQGIGFAEMAGCSADAARWRADAAALRTAINHRYFDEERGRYANGAQTASLLPLAFGIVPPAERSRVFHHIVSGLLESGEPVIGTGLIGTGWLLRTLSAHGRADLACAIAARTDYPSWGYMMEHGATTIWELWNGNTADPAMNSGNHVMLLGDFLPWLFEDLAGIQPAEPGFRRILLRPVFAEALDHVSASHQAMPGEIRSEWRRDEAGLIEWTFSVPANTKATVVLPAMAAEPSAPDATDIAVTASGWRGEFGPGTHSLQILPAKSVSSVPVLT